MQAVSGKVRKYYIAAEEGDWNYAPGGDKVTYMLPDAMKEGMVMMEDNMGTTTYKKAMYVEYEDEAFTKKVCMCVCVCVCICTCVCMP
jgi:hypothetical protein